MKTIVRLIIGMCLFPLLAGSEWAIHAQETYQYAYLYKTDGDKPATLALVSLSTPDRLQTIDLPQIEGKMLGLYGAIPDPTGTWLALPFLKYNSEPELYLYNVLSKEFRYIAAGNFALRDSQGYPDQRISWSPDGNYLAFSVGQPLTSDGLAIGVYVYSLADQNLTLLKEVLDYLPRIAWSHDSKFIVVSIRTCTDTQICDFALASIETNSAIERQTIQLPLGELTRDSSLAIDTACSIKVSPDNRFVSFALFCTYMPLPISHWRMYVWDTLTNELLPLGNFIDDIKESTSHIYSGAYYTAVWIASDILLVGAIWDTGESIETRTISIHLPDRKITELLPEAVEEWASNPVSDELAYRAVPSISMQLLTVESADLNIGTADSDGSKLENISKYTINACNLVWSPDGIVLAYTIQKEHTTFGRNCSTAATSIGFIGSDGIMIEHTVVGPSDPDRIQQVAPVGWVRVQ